MCVYMYAYIPWLCSLRASKDRATPIVMNTLSTQILIAKYYSPLKGARAPCRNDWFQGWGRENTRWAWSILSCQMIRKCFKEWWAHIKRTRSQFKGTTTSQIWDHVNIKIMITIDYNLFNKKGIHESILIHRNQWINTQGEEKAFPYNGIPSDECGSNYGIRKSPFGNHDSNN